MRFKLIRIGLLLGTLVMAGAGIIFLVVLGTTPLAPPRSATNTLPRLPEAMTAAKIPSVVLTENDFVFVWKKRLQRPLEDPPPPRPAQATPSPVAQKPVPIFTLVGTLVDSDPVESRAWIELSGGKRRLLGVGDPLADEPGAPVVRVIEDRKVTFGWEDGEIVKEMLPDAKNRFEQ